MEITTEMLADLKAKAKAATPGPWEKDCLRNISGNRKTGTEIGSQLSWPRKPRQIFSRSGKHGLHRRRFPGRGAGYGLRDRTAAGGK